MACEVEHTDEFEGWWDRLSEAEQESVDAYVRMLQSRGVSLAYPHCSGINGSKHGHMRELRVQHAGEPYRVFYAFDPRRTAILLIGGCKTGEDRFYEEYIPVADKIYDDHLETLRKEKAAEDAAAKKTRR